MSEGRKQPCTETLHGLRQDCSHRPRDDRGPLYAQFLAAGGACRRYPCRSRQAASGDERGFHALPRRERRTASAGADLRASRHPAVDRLGRRRCAALLLSRLEVRPRRALHRGTGRARGLLQDRFDPLLPDARISRPVLRLSRRRRSAALPALSRSRSRWHPRDIVLSPRLQLLQQPREPMRPGACRFRASHLGLHRRRPYRRAASIGRRDGLGPGA